MPARSRPESWVPIRRDTEDPDLHGDAYQKVFSPREGIDVLIRIRGHDEGQPVVYELRVLTTKGEEVQAADLRSIPLAQFKNELMASLALSTLGTDDPMRITTLTYDLATRAGDDALAAVARQLGVSRATAATRVREARAAGYLPPRDRRRAQNTATPAPKTPRRSERLAKRSARVAPRVAKLPEVGRSTPM